MLPNHLVRKSIYVQVQIVLLCSNMCTGNVIFPTSMTQNRTTNRHFTAGTLFVFTTSFAVAKYMFDNIVTKSWLI